MTLMMPPAVRPKFGAGSGRHNLKLFHGIQRNVDGRTLTSQLLAEEAIVVVAAIKTYVIENASLSGKRDLVAIRALHHAHARRQR